MIQRPANMRTTGVFWSALFGLLLVLASTGCAAGATDEGDETTDPTESSDGDELIVQRALQAEGTDEPPPAPEVAFSIGRTEGIGVEIRGPFPEPWTPSPSKK